MEKYIDVNRNAYNNLSYEYQNRGVIKSGYEETPEFLANNVLKFKNANNCLSILEIGPGSGEILEYFESLGHRTIAVELSEKIIGIAKTRSPKTIFINSNILDVNFTENQFDVIYAGALIHLFPENDADTLLFKIYNFLKSDGVLFVNTTINSKTEEGFYTKNDYNNTISRFRRKWTEDDFENFVSKYFKIEHKLYTDELDRKKKWVAFICKK